ncbi:MULTISPECIES: CBS domain-containing protein [unclassified Haladaptatus]|uniref:CBS domain-containing protein n=1 Tax=unclassified Haladaptatus TaxID=2622732 RepID=UPI00209C6C51|nr:MULTISPECIES: CBS domain-containing protein [unclassified Haladaptatus]MCO8246894.1 CBS domain-containing protein [Haladaptatus sp. AB643]MCO8253580.1 CBS domain-containing protein [Haladaptatus sp. AB618]
MPVKDIASMEVITANDETELVDIASMMSEENVGCVPIVDGERPVGIVTDRKIALSLADEADASGRTVGDVMTRDPITIDADASVHDAIERMDDANIRRIPVVENGNLTGIVTLDDVLVTLADEMDDAAEVIEEQTPRF